MSKRRTARRVRRTAPDVELALSATMRRAAGASTWWWSPEAFKLHGFQVGDVVPTTPLLLSHIHPDDRTLWEALLGTQTTERVPVVARLRRADGCERLVVGVAAHNHAAIEVSIADVTPLVAAEAGRLADAEVAVLAGAIAALEQAKGVVMAAFGLSAEAASALLQEAASRTGTDVTELAARLMAQVEAGGAAHEQLLGALLPTLRGA